MYNIDLGLSFDSESPRWILQYSREPQCKCIGFLKRNLSNTVRNYNCDAITRMKQFDRNKFDSNKKKIGLSEKIQE